MPILYVLSTSLLGDKAADGVVAVEFEDDSHNRAKRVGVAPLDEPDMPCKAHRVHYNSVKEDGLGILFVIKFGVSQILQITNLSCFNNYMEDS